MALVAKGLSNTVIDATNPDLASNGEWGVRRDLPVQRFVVNDDSLPTIPIRLLDRTNHAYTQLNGTGNFNRTDFTMGNHVVRFDGIMGTTTKTGHNLVLTGDANYSSVQLTSDTAIPYTSSGGTNLGNSGLDVAVTESITGGSFTAPTMDETNFGGITGLDAAVTTRTTPDSSSFSGNSGTTMLIAGNYYDFQVQARATNSLARSNVALLLQSDRADTGISITSSVGSNGNNPNQFNRWARDANEDGTYEDVLNSTAPVGETLRVGRVLQYRSDGDSTSGNYNVDARIRVTGTPSANTLLTWSNGGFNQGLSLQQSAPVAGRQALTIADQGSAAVTSFTNNTGEDLTIEGTTIANGATGTPIISGTVDITTRYQAAVTNNGLATASVATGTSTTARTIAVNASEVYPLGTNSSGSLTGSWVNVTPFTVTPTGSTPTGTGISLSTTALTNDSLSSIRLSTVTAPPTGTLYTHTISNSLELTEEIANAASTLGFTTAGNGYLNLSSTDNAARSASRTTMTISCWVKKSWIGSGAGVNAEGEPILSSANDSNNYTEIRLSTPTTAGGPTNASIRLLHRDNGTANIDVRTVDGQEFDWNEWTHVVVAVDTTQATPADRVKIYLNGILKEGSDLQTATYPSLNKGLDWEGTIHTDGLRIGDNNIGNEFSGNIADFYYIDNQQLNATAFGTTNQTIWIPSNYTGTMNTASFHLDFSDAANLGNDTSSNNIDFSTVSSNFNVPRGSGPTITQASAQQSPNTPTNNIPNLLGADDVNSSSNVRFLNNGYTLAGPSGVTNNGQLVSTSGIFEDDRRYYFELYFQHRTGGTTSNVRPLLWPSTNSVQTATGDDLAFRNAFGGGTTVSSLRYYAIDTGTGDIWFASTSSSTTAYSDAFRMAVENADTGDPNFALNYKTLGITTDQLRFTYHDYTSNAGGSASTYVNLGQSTMYNNPPSGYTTVVQGIPNITTNVNQVIAEQGTYAVANATQATGLFAENILHDANATGTFGGVTIAEVRTAAPIDLQNQALPTTNPTNNYAGINGLFVNIPTPRINMSLAAPTSNGSTPNFGVNGLTVMRSSSTINVPGTAFINWSLRSDSARTYNVPGPITSVTSSTGVTRVNGIRIDQGGGSAANGLRSVTITNTQERNTQSGRINYSTSTPVTTVTYTFTNNSSRTLTIEGTSLPSNNTATVIAVSGNIDIEADGVYRFQNTSDRILNIQDTILSPGSAQTTIAPVGDTFDNERFDITSDGIWNITATNGTGGDIIVDPAVPDRAAMRIQSTTTTPVTVITLTGPGPMRPAFDLDIATPAVTADGRPADSQSFAAFVDFELDPIPIAVETDGTVNMDTDNNPILGLDLSNFTGTFTTA